MKKLQMEFNYLSQTKDTGIIKIEGDIDSGSIPEFREFMEQSLSNPCQKLLIDLQNLSYANSSGFGILASAALGEQEKSNKKIVFCNMQSLILQVYTIFGMDQVCPQFPSLEEALSYLQTPERKLEEKVVFPLIRSCTECQRPSNFPKAGHYKCPYCSTVHYLDEEGNLKQINRSKKKKASKEKAFASNIDEVDITLPSDKQHLSKLRDFIFSFLVDMFSEEERSRMAMAVDEACANAIEHAHNDDRNKKIHLHIEVNPEKFSITVTDNGVNTFKNIVHRDQVNQDVLKETGRGMGLILIKQMMDEVNLKPTETWGTSITMTKYVKKQE